MIFGGIGVSHRKNFQCEERAWRNIASLHLQVQHMHRLTLAAVPLRRRIPYCHELPRTNASPIPRQLHCLPKASLASPGRTKFPAPSRDPQCLFLDWPGYPNYQQRSATGPFHALIQTTRLVVETLNHQVLGSLFLRHNLRSHGQDDGSKTHWSLILSNFYQCSPTYVEPYVFDNRSVFGLE